MATTKLASTDSAEALQGLINDVLIQRGKALKSLSRDDRHQAQAHISLQTKMPEIIESFHWKLDDLEGEIIRAKAALQRDLDRLREQRLPTQQPAPVEAQTKSPMELDLESSQEPSPENKAQSTEALEPHMAPAEPSAAPSMAPFPDMGLSFQPAAEPPLSVKPETTSAMPAMMAPMGNAKSESKSMPPVAQAQPSGAPEAPMDDLFSLGSGDAGRGAGGNNSEFHFTDMTFSLAPPNSDSQGQSQPQPQNPGMNMSFGSGDMGGDLLSLDNLLPQDNAAKTEPAATQATMAAANQEEPPEAKAEKQDSTNLDDLFNMDGNANLENMDLDINMGGNGGDSSTFDDMYFGDMTEMEHGKFDEAFFGIQ